MPKSTAIVKVDNESSQLDVVGQMSYSRYGLYSHLFSLEFPELGLYVSLRSVERYLDL